MNPAARNFVPLMRYTSITPDSTPDQREVFAHETQRQLEVWGDAYWERIKDDDGQTRKIWLLGCRQNGGLPAASGLVGKIHLEDGVVIADKMVPANELC